MYRPETDWQILLQTVLKMPLIPKCINILQSYQPYINIIVCWKFLKARFPGLTVIQLI